MEKPKRHSPGRNNELNCKQCKIWFKPKPSHSKHIYIFCSKSCHAKYRFTKHNESKTAFYHRWRGIYRRCNDKKLLSYKNYGGRGIKCLWENYLSFKKDMYVSFLKHVNQFGLIQTSLDRVNNDGNYSKRNCKWATRKEQINNSRRSLKIIYKNKINDLL